MLNKLQLFKVSLLSFLLLFADCKPNELDPKNSINISDYIDPRFTIQGNPDFVMSGLNFDTGGDLADGLGYSYDDIREPDERGWTISTYCGGFDFKKNALKLFFVRPGKTEYLKIVSKKDDLYYLLNEDKTRVLKMKVVKEQKKYQETGELYTSYEYKLYKLTGDLNKYSLTDGTLGPNTYEECIEWYTANYKGGAHSSPDYAPEPNVNKTE